MNKIYYILFFTLTSCSSVSTVYNINQPLPNTEYTLIGQISIKCDDNKYENTYDFLINEAIDKYGDGVDIINITKDKIGTPFSSYSYINAHVIKYLISNDFNTYNLNKSINDSNSTTQDDFTNKVVSPSNEITVGMMVKVRVNGEIVNAEIIKVLDGERCAISYKDAKAKTNKMYIQNNQIIKE